MGGTLTHPAQDQAKEERDRSSEVRDGNVWMSGGNGAGPKRVREVGAKGMIARWENSPKVSHLYKLCVIGRENEILRLN